MVLKTCFGGCEGTGRACDGGSRCEVTPQPGLRGWCWRLESTGSPRGPPGDQERWQKKRSQQLMEKAPAPTWVIPAGCATWVLRAEPPDPGPELGRAREGSAASAHSRDLKNVIKTQYTFFQSNALLRSR